MTGAVGSRSGGRRAVALLASLLALAGCGREPRFVPPAADSALVAGRDAFAERVRVAQQRWTGAEDGAEAARLSAELLLADLRARVAGPAPGTPAGSGSPGAAAAHWEPRARELLDSLGIGAECAGAPGALAVNFFSRSDPSAGSWPWLFWDDAGAIAAQAVEGQGLGLVALAARGLGGSVAPAPPAIAALFSRRAGGGSQPLLMAWSAAAGLGPAQTLGPDSLGGTGSGAFAAGEDGATWLTTRTWRPTPRFEECAGCPHVVHERRFRWEPEGFRLVEDRVLPSPYAAFVDFVRALAAGDHDAALRLATRPGVVASAQDAGWGTVRGSWRAAPGQGGREDELVFYRGAREAWRVGFEHGPDGWRVDTVTPVPRVIE